MGDCQFVADSERISEIKRSLVQTYIDCDGWEIHFEDAITNEKWIEYRMEPEYHGGGYPILVRLPLPDPEALVEIAFRSNNLDEVAGAAILLSSYERIDGIDFREMLIDKIEKYLNDRCDLISEIDSKKVITVIYETDLADSTNRKSVVGKHYSEIERDYCYYKTIAQRAKKVLDHLQQK